MALPMNLIMTKRSWIPHIHSRKFDDLRPEFPFDLFFLAAFMNTWPPKTAAESRWMKVFYGGSTGTLKNMRKWGIVTLLLWKIKVLMHRPNYSEACSSSFTWERMGIEWCWWSSPWFRQKWPGSLHVWQGPVAVSYSKKNRSSPAFIYFAGVCIKTYSQTEAFANLLKNKTSPLKS